MLQNYFHDFSYWIHNHAQWAAFIAYIVAMTESLAVIGSIIPGSVLMAAIGGLIGASIIPLHTTLLFAILGAITGDTISYYLGHYFKDRIHKIWPFNKMKPALDKAEIFLNKHGGVSIFIGRFTGPIRAFIPVLAGMLNMSPLRFFPINIASACLWAPAYMLPGILIGLASTELSPRATTHALFNLFLLFLLTWISVWLILHFLKRIIRTTHRIIRTLWAFIKEHPSLNLLKLALNNASDPEEGQLGSALFTLICLSLLGFLTFYISHHASTQIGANEAIYHLFRGLHSLSFLNTALIITGLGEKYIILPVALIMALYFIWQQKRFTGITLLLLIPAVGGFNSIVKHLIGSPRPNGISDIILSYSYPSGHTALSAAFFGFFAFIITRQMKAKQRWLPTTIAIIVVLLVASSRLYVGIHWLTDLAGGLLLSLSLLTIAIIALRHAKPENIKIGQTLALLTILLTLGLGIYSQIKLPKDRLLAIPTWPQTIMEKTAWWEDRWSELPALRNNRLGHPVAPLNIQWQGQLVIIKDYLKQQGWYAPNNNILVKMISRLSGEKYSGIPIFPYLYNDQKPKLILLKDLPDGRVLRVILWPANVKLNPEKEPLWVGNISFLEPLNIFKIKHHSETMNEYAEAQNLFLASLKAQKIKHVSKLTLYRKHLLQIPIKLVK